MKLKFTKMTGAGNDFIVIDDQKFKPKPKLIQRLCDRHFGIGADGILWIQKSKIADFGVRYFNADGSGDTLCINGARCAVLYGFQNKMCKKKCRFEFIGKIFRAEILAGDQVKIFLDYSPKFDLDRKINLRSKIISVSYFDLGSKHIVIEWKKLQELFDEEFSSVNFEEFDIYDFGKQLRFHPSFQPDGVNVNFIEKISEQFYKIRTYERGVEAETLACGSGSIASAIYVYLENKVTTPIKLETKSGRILEVDFEFLEGIIQNISIVGHTEKVFEGIIDL